MTNYVYTSSVVVLKSMYFLGTYLILEYILAEYWNLVAISGGHTYVIVCKYILVKNFGVFGLLP